MPHGKIGRGAREHQFVRCIALRLVEEAIVCVARSAYKLRQLSWMIFHVTLENCGKGPVELLGLPIGLSLIRSCELIVNGEKFQTFWNKSKTK